jgi:hypothetical protein
MALFLHSTGHLDGLLPRRKDTVPTDLPFANRTSRLCDKVLDAQKLICALL